MASIDTEIKTPYHSVRVHIGELTTKANMGVKTRSIELTYGNQSKRVLVENPDDIADIEETDIAKEIWKIWEDVTNEGKIKGHKFVEDIEDDS